MKKCAAFLVLALAAAACGKDKYETAPQLKLLSVSNTVVPVNGTLRVLMQYTDKQGDVSDSFYIYKKRLNASVVRTLRDSVKSVLPQFPATPKGELEFNLTYQEYLLSAENPPRIPGSDPVKYEADTLRIAFLVKDKGGNKSDSVILDNIVVLR